MLHIPEGSNYASETQAAFTDKLLELAGYLPQVDWGLLAQFQEARQTQLGSAQRHYDRSRPPENARLEFRYTRLIELFHVEDFEQLHHGLTRLLPELLSERADRDFNVFFERVSSHASSDAWLNVGFLYKDTRPPLELLPIRQLEDLPNVVERIYIWLHKILPVGWKNLIRARNHPQAASR